jgi:hypothetical protein
LYQFVYISRALQRFSEEELAQLCARSIERNRTVGVTGLLLYDGTRFIQALEGEHGAVLAIVDRITRDDRHTDIDVMADRPVDTQQFGLWSMEVKQAAAGCCSREFLDKVKQDVSAVDDTAMRAAFIGFAVLGTGSGTGYRCSAG